MNARAEWNPDRDPRELVVVAKRRRKARQSGLAALAVAVLSALMVWRARKTRPPSLPPSLRADLGLPPSEPRRWWDYR